MTQSPFIRADDAAKKSFDFSPWGGLEGFLEASKAGAGGIAMLKRLVPDLAHAVDMTAAAVSGLPFEIVDEGGEVFDTSTDWENKLGGMENPQRLIYLIASSLCGGSAYVIPQRTPRLIFNLQYAAPHTIAPMILMEGLQWFDRASDQGKVQKFKPKELLYFWLPDSDVELGPAQNHPLANAALDAQLVWAMKSTLKKYGERGFVPITLLGASGMPNPADREKSEKFFDRLLRGGFDVLAKIVNADSLSLVPIGAGMEQLKQSYLEIRRDAKESIADAFGIPPSMFMSDKAYASEMDVLMRQWYSDSRFVSIYQTIQETFTEQLFKPYGYSMRFALDTLDIFQEDEAERSQSLAHFVTAVSTDPQTAKLGMSIMGYDMDAEQEKALDELVAKKEEEKKAEQEMASAQMEQDATLQREALAAKPQPGKKHTPADIQRMIPAKALELSADELKDLALWYSKAKAWHVRGKGNAVDWENKNLREEVAAPIRLKLAAAMTELDIMQAFQFANSEAQTTTPVPEYTEETNTHTEAIKALAAVVERAITEIKAEPSTTPSPVFNMTMPSISLTAQMPEAGTVNVNVPEQPAPVVNVTNQVNPTPVKVENNVQPADVTVIPEQKKKVDIKVKRDAKGNIESAQGKIE